MSFPRFPLFVAASLLILQPAGATSVKTGKPEASQAPAHATRDQLRECMDTEDTLKARFKVIEASNDAHEKRVDQIQAEDDKLLALQSQVGHDSETSIRAYNAAIKEHNLHVRQLNQEAADSQPANAAYNDDMVAFNHKCAKLVYRVDDMEAVMKERKKAAPAASASAP